MVFAGIFNFVSCWGKHFDSTLYAEESGGPDSKQLYHGLWNLKCMMMWQSLKGGLCNREISRYLIFAEDTGQK